MKEQLNRIQDFDGGMIVMNKMRTPWKRILLVSVVAVCAMLLWCAGALADIHLGPWGT